MNNRISFHFGFQNRLLIVLVSSTVWVHSAQTQVDTRARLLEALPTATQNDFYVGNRVPLLPSPLYKLPPGSIRPEGWLRHQLELMAHGFTGNLSEISKWCKFEGNAWASTHGEGQSGWEELPYWLKGFIDLGYILKDTRIMNEANRWVDVVLSSQEPDGYFGPRGNKDAYDLWPNMIMLYVLRSYYDATGDKRVLTFMSNFFRWLNTVSLEHFLGGSFQTWRQGDYYPIVEIPRYSNTLWQKWRGGDNLDHIYWLYNRTGESWLLDLARLNHERTADWTGGIPTWHGVNLCQGFREPAEYYQQSQDIRYLKATDRNYDVIMASYGQVPGGMFGADENARSGYSEPRQAAETCSMVEFMHSDEMLLKITGDLAWADRAEEIAFNSLPAAMTADLKGLHYLTAPNMIQLDSANKFPLFDNDGDNLSYNPWRYRCCQHNVAFGWPYFAEHLWAATPGNGLAAVFYAAGTVQAKVGHGAEVKIKETTEYPFDDVVEFKITLDKAAQFPLILRVPGWCENARVQINGEPIKIQTKPSRWIVVDRMWKNNDVVKLEMPMAIRVKVWEKNKNAVSVYRGPLAYSLKIGERWERLGGTDTWPAFQVFPTSPWNYGLIVDVKNPGTSLELVKKNKPLAPQPFTTENAPVELQAKAKRIPQWKPEQNGLIGALQDSPVRCDEKVETITLIPMGCARLRVSAFPRISESPDAHTWK